MHTIITCGSYTFYPLFEVHLWICDLRAVGKSENPGVPQARLWAWGRGDMSTPSFGSHLNPISTMGGRLCSPYTGVHTKF